MRINVYLSSKGICSRREADRFVESGRVRVNDQVAKIGMDIDEFDRVTLDGKPIRVAPKTVYLAYHKPIGVESTTDQSKPHNIIDAIKFPERIFPIGRLDKDSSGLILLTNDGQIVNQILRSENAHEKEYLVTVDRDITPDFLHQMQCGVEIYNPVKHRKQTTLPTKINKLGARKFSIVLVQGLNLQIRRMCSALGYHVMTLKRIRIMNLSLGDLPSGKYLILDESQIASLRAMMEDVSSSKS